MLIFVYGTLRKGQRNHYVLGKSRFVGEFEVIGYKMLNINNMFPGLVRDNSNEVPITGEVYDCTPDIVEALDWFEGYCEVFPEQSLYVRAKMRDFHAPCGSDVWTYFWNGLIEDYEVVESGDWNAK